MGVFADSASNIFIADKGNHRIRMIDRKGGNFISTIAGTGKKGFSGDGEPAIQAALDQPFGVFVNSENKIFIADTGNSRVRVIDRGIIRTTAGTGERNLPNDGNSATHTSFVWPSGVFVDADGKTFVADTGNQCVNLIDRSGRIWTVAGYRGYPKGVFVHKDKGRVYIAESNRVLRLSGWFKC